MKTIENKKVLFLPSNEKSTYGDLLEMCISAPEQGGFTIDDIEKRLRIRKAIKKDVKEIKLEDADYKIAKQCVLKMRWRIVDESLVEFKNDFISAEKEKAE